MKTSLNTEVNTALVSTRNGDKYRITYKSKEETKQLIATIVPYAQSAQGKRTLESKGEIKASPYENAQGYGEGVKVLKSNPDGGLYLAFQKLMRCETSGKFIPAEHRTMKAETMTAIEKIA